MGDGFGLQIVVVGVGACAVFDVWQRIFQWFTSIPPSNWAIVGRWTIGLLTSGQLIVRDLELRPNMRNELGVGWFVHYVIAVVYAAIFMLLMRANILTAANTTNTALTTTSDYSPIRNPRDGSKLGSA